MGKEKWKGYKGNFLSLEGELAVDETSKACSMPTALTEDVGRYGGDISTGKKLLGLLWRSVMNLDRGGGYVTTTVVLLLFPLILLFPAFWKAGAEKLRYVFVWAVGILVYWVAFGNGIPWHAVGAFWGAVVCFVFFTSNKEGWVKIIAWLVVIITLLFNVIVRYKDFVLQKDIYAFWSGQISGKAMELSTFSGFNEVSNRIWERYEKFPDAPYVYRIGTSIPYFVPRGPSILAINDTLLDVFNCLYAERDYKLTLKRLRALKISSIIYSSGVGTTEKDPNGTLHQKIKAFEDFVSKSEGRIEVILKNVSTGIVLYALSPDLVRIESGQGVADQ